MMAEPPVRRVRPDVEGSASDSTPPSTSADPPRTVWVLYAAALSLGLIQLIIAIVGGLLRDQTVSDEGHPKLVWFGYLSTAHYSLLPIVVFPYLYGVCLPALL